MMGENRPAFVPLDRDDVDDAVIERLAREKGVGALQRPGKPAAAPEEERAPDDAQKAERPRMKTLNLELPVYLWRELKLRAVDAETSVRHLIIAALKNDAYTVEDADMIEDGRRLR